MVPQVSGEGRDDMDIEEEMPAEQSSYLAATTELEEQEALTAEYSAALATLEVGLGLSDEEEQEEVSLRGLLTSYNSFVLIK